jgi:acyl-CoA oxidase
MTVTAPQLPTSGTDEIVRLVFDGGFEADHEDIRDALRHPIFDPRSGLSLAYAGRLAYRRTQRLHERLERPVEVVRNPARLFALAEWSSLLDASLFSLVMVHYNLCLGTVLEHGGDRAELHDYVDELDGLTSFGLYMATELGYGNNVAALRTEAVYHRESETFVVNTPGPLAQKFMSYSGFADIPKLAVVLARVIVDGNDEGVYPLLVRISDQDGLCEGVRAAPCPEKPVQGLDNGVTSFDRVRVPRRNLLLGDMGEFLPDGSFRPGSGNRRSRFLRAMTRIHPGRLCVSSSAVGAGRASVYIALRYAAQRHTNGPGRPDMPVIEYRSHQLALFAALAKVYAMTFLLNHAKRAYLGRARPDVPPAELNELIALTKALCTWEITDVVTVCRERCGAQGMFSVNRIADYVSLLQGLVTAEGDNQVLLATTVGRLLAQRDRDPDAVAAPAAPAAVEDPDAQLRLLRYREHALIASARDALSDRTRPYADAWNATINQALAIGHVRGARIALESFPSTEADEVHEAIQLLASLYGLTEIQRDAGWYLARGALTAEQVERIPAALDALCERIAVHVPLLLDGFCLSPDLLRAPIASDDYAAAYQRVAGVR